MAVITKENLRKNPKSNIFDEKYVSTSVICGWRLFDVLLEHICQGANTKQMEDVTRK